MNRWQNIIPYQKFQLESELGLSEIHDRMNEQVEQPSFLGVKTTNKPFIGTYKENSFKLRAIEKAKKSLIPISIGVMEEKKGKVYINVLIRFTTIVQVYIVVFSLLIICSSAINILQSADGERFGSFFIQTIVVFSIALIMLLFGFHSRKKVAIAALQKLFEAKMRE